MRALIWCVVVVCCSRDAAAGADEDGDLALIPTAPVDVTPPPAAPSTIDAKLYLDDAATANARRSPIVPYPPPLPYDAQNRTSFDTAVAWSPTSHLKLVESDRLDVVEQAGDPLWSRTTVRDAVRELYASWEPMTRTYLEVGRINVRDGTALGFDPTDFLRARTLVGQASLDPSVLRVNRLGTVMALARTIWTGGSASVLVAPKLADITAIDTRTSALDPRLDATNASDRARGEVSASLGDTSVQLLGFLEHHRSKLGANVTRPIGNRVIVHAEWAGGFEQDLVTRALADGRVTGTIPEAAPAPFATDTRSAFRNDLAAGGSLTLGTSVTINAEYHLHQAGFSRDDWRRWFAAGTQTPALAGGLWSVRGYANDQLEPMSRHEIFVRADCPKVVNDHLEIAGFAFVNLGDGSTLSQVTASYYASDAWTLALSLDASLGGARSEHGSAPNALGAVLEIIRYL